MALSTYCAGCLLRKQLDALDKKNIPESQKQSFLKELLHLLAATDADDSAPSVLYRIEALHRQLIGPMPDFDAVKQKYNTLMLAQEDHLRDAVCRAADPVFAALQISMMGNYIDFGAASAVDDTTLRRLLDEAFQQEIAQTEYMAFCRDMDTAKTMVYLTDNCGEIVADKLFIEQLRLRWPNVSIIAVVRGGNAVNDATMDDALAVGLDRVVPVRSSGCAMAGTDIRLVDDDIRQLLQNTDLILAKGQGNFETMNEGVLPVYFAFLCKCDWFTRRFGLEKYKPVFVKRERLKINIL